MVTSCRGLMVLIYWAMMTPYQVSVRTAWMTGLVVDLLNGTLLATTRLHCIVIYLFQMCTLAYRLHTLLREGSTFFNFLLRLSVGPYREVLSDDTGRSSALWFCCDPQLSFWPWLFVVMETVADGLSS